MNRCIALLSAALLLTTAAHADSPLPSVVDGSWTVDGCGYVSSVRLHMDGSPLQIPAPRWRIEIAGSACGQGVAATCDGDGYLRSGVTFGTCVPGGAGSLGVVVECIPGPISQTPRVTHGAATLTFTFGTFSFGGTMDLTLAGGAPDEAQNICL